MRVAGIVVNYRVAPLALEAVRSLLAELDDGGRILLVDNASGDDSLALLERAVREQGFGERVQLIASERNGGFGAGNNLAFRAALAWPDPPDFFFLLNPDARVRPGTLAALLRFFAASPSAGIAGTRLFDEHGAPSASCFRFPSVLGELEAGLHLGLASRLLERWVVPMPPPDTTCEVDWVSGASFMIQRDALLRAGLFDEGFFLYCEEIDLCRRVRQAGYSVHYVHDTAVEHVEAAATRMRGTRRRPSYWFDSRSRYYRKHHGAGYDAAARLAWIVGASLYRARCLVSGAAVEGPERALRDEIAHFVRRRGAGEAERR